MYKLLIAEDEEFIRKGIAKSIPWKDLGFGVVCEAKNGRDALDQMEALRPDVVLTDIRMPVMDGLELAKQVRTNYPDTELVILSGFSDFAYAQEAIRFNVFEYLLKPTDMGKFLDCFTRLREKLDNKQEERDSLFAMRTKLDEGLEKLRESFLYALLKGEEDPFTPLEERMEHLEIDLKGDRYTAAVISIGGNQEVLEQWNKSLLLYAYRNIVGEVLSETGKSMAVIPDVNEILLILCFDSSHKRHLAVDKCVEDIVSHLGNTICKEEPGLIRAGVGLTYPEITQLPRSYAQARKALDQEFFLEGVTVHHFREGVEYEFETKWIQNYPEEAAKVVESVVSGNQEQTAQLIGQMFRHFLERKVSSALIKNYCNTLLLLLRSKLGDLADRVAPGLSGADERINGSCSVSALNDYIRDTLEQISTAVSQLEEGEFTYRQRMVAGIKQYIEEQYSRSLSIGDICAEMHISQSYLSNIFKAHTGCTCMEYVKQVRIAKTKELLKTTDLRVYEIAEAVGYSDYKYFVTQFKKITGMSPTDYRDSKVLA